MEMLSHADHQPGAAAKAGLRWEPLAAASGIVFAVLWMAGHTVARRLSGPLVYNAPAEEVRRYFIENDAALHIGAHLTGVSIFFLFAFTGALWSVLRRAEGGTGWLSALVFGGGATTGALLLAQQAAFRAGFHGMHVSDLDPQAARALFALYINFEFGTVFTLAVLLAATALLVLRTGVLPGWLGWASAVLAALCLVVGGQAPYAAFPLFLLWVAAASIVLTRRLSEPTGPVGV